MKNNYGFGKFEGLTIIVLLLGVVAFFMYTTLEGVSPKKLEKFKEIPVSFNKAVYTNLDSYQNSNLVYLQEVIDQGYLKNVKSPFSDGYCDYLESKVETVQLSERYVTLKCDNFLISKVRSTNLKSAVIYEVSDWSLERPEGDTVDEAVLYNCQSADGSTIFPNYLEEGAFLYSYNKLYSNSYYRISDIKPGICTVVSNTFYRTRKEYSAK